VPPADDRGVGLGASGIDFEKFLDISHDMLCVAGADGSLKRVNASFERTLGWPSRELLDRRRLADLAHPDDVPATISEVQKLASGAPGIAFENRCRCADGSVKWLYWTAFLDRRADLIYAVARDITEQRKDRESFQLALEASPVAMVLVDDNGSIVYVNQQAEQVFGYDRHKLLDKNIEVLVPRQFRQTHRAHRERLFQVPRACPMGSRQDLTAVRGDGTEFPVEIGLSPVAIASGEFVLSAIIDLTERKRTEEQIAEQARALKEANARLVEMASTDSLTSVWNRRAFLDQLGIQMELALRTSRPLSIVFLDLDHFKTYNDEFGHLAGDEVLTQAAAILRKKARRSDYVARIGGEEFGALLPETDRPGAIRLAERFRGGIANATWPRRHITASFGVTTVEFAKTHTEIDVGERSRLLAEADRALYHSKDGGRNRVTHVWEIIGLR
jgi:diguanylate cyclase (GGDEF)-like protein/PAS domain S-box-containing protein